MFAQFLVLSLFGDFNVPVHSQISSYNFDEKCHICMQLAEETKKLAENESEEMIKLRALNYSEIVFANSTASGNIFRTELNCHWRKYYYDANWNPWATPLSTCADTGFCPKMFQTVPISLVDITNSTNEYDLQCNRIAAILIHHTVDPTLQKTLSALNKSELSVNYIVDVDGKIYQQVDDWHGTYHSGNGKWRENAFLNHKSIGIENVNTGNQPFTEPQLASLFLLVETLKKRWFIEDINIAAHSDYAPGRKQDPSAFFPWNRLYNYLKIFPELFVSSTPMEELRAVLQSPSKFDPIGLSKVQEGLYSIGYRYLAMTVGSYDNNTAANIEAFNRHFSPETFIKEILVCTNEACDGWETVLNPVNSYWYGASQERLDYLLNFYTTPQTTPQTITAIPRETTTTAGNSAQNSSKADSNSKKSAHFIGTSLFALLTFLLS